MSINIYNYTDYKKVVDLNIKADKPSRGALTRLARSCACQPSYLSQVLKAHVHLTPEQAYMVGEHFGWGQDDRQYFLDLLLWQKSSEGAYKKHLKQRIDKVRKKKNEVGERLERPKTEFNEQTFQYYSHWSVAAIHILTSIDRLGDSLAMSQHLNLPHELVLEKLEILKQMGLVRRSGKLWLDNLKDVHLPRNSALIQWHLNNWRQRALEHAQKSNDHGIHFSGLYTLEKEKAVELKEFVMKAMQDFNKKASDTEAEVGLCLNVDLFEL